MRRRVRALVLSGIVVGGLLTGFSTSGVAAAPAKRHTITLTLADNGHSYRLHKGDIVDVQLSGSPDFTWAEPGSSNQTVLERTGGSSGATATATFVAIKKGKVEVTATASPNCSGEICPALMLGFQVFVSVVG